MNFVALTCPQCGGPLPRQASWRMVECPHCRAMVTRSAAVVQRAEFHAALLRSLGERGGSARVLHAGGADYRLGARLATGSSADVFEGERLGAAAARVTVKLARDGPAPALAAEAAALASLQASTGPLAAYFTQRLPQLVFSGRGDDSGRPCIVSVLRRPAGYWGSLADVQRANPAGIDPRHAVWMWRRVLELLGFIHSLGWSHGDLAPEHLLVHPADHGILVIGWSRARLLPPGSAREQAASRDLRQLAWALREVLRGDSLAPPEPPSTVPEPLAALLRRASDDERWLREQGAAGVERALDAAAQASFGAPRFLPFDPQPGRQAPA